MSRSRTRVVAVLSACLAAVATLAGPPPPASAVGESLFLELRCVSAPVTGSVWDAHFRVFNPESTSVVVAIGASNFFSPRPNRGQPLLFPPGWSSFGTSFTEAEAQAAWTLAGKTVTATASSSLCETKVSDVVVAGIPAIDNVLTMAGERATLLLDSYDVSYRWFRDCNGSPVQVGTGRTYTPQAADAGKRIGATVTYSHGATGLAISSACGPEATVGSRPTWTVAPAVVGVPRVGEALSLTAAAATDEVDRTVRWDRCDASACVPVGTGSTWTVDDASVGMSVRAVVTATNGFGSTPVTSAAVGPVRPAVPVPGTLLPGAVDFPATVVGGSSSTTVHYVNSTLDPVVVTPAVTGTHAASFAVFGDDCGPVVAPGGHCAISVRFTPVADGALTAVLEVGDGATTTLAGQAFIAKAAPPPVPPPAPAALALSAARLDLGKVPVRKQGRARAVTIRNSGGTALVVQAVTVTGKHRRDVVLATTCPGDTLAPGASCTVTLRLRPAAAGRRTANLVVTSTAPGGSRSVALVGEGVRRRT